MQIRSRILALTTLVMCLSGCLLINDFGSYWQKATIDKDLVGMWYDETNNQKVILIQEKDHLAYMNKNTGKPDDDTQIKTLLVGKHSFLLMQNSSSKALFFYTKEQDIFSIFAPKKDGHDDFIEYTKNDANISLNEKGIVVNQLNQDVLTKIVSSIENSSWTEVATLTRGFAESSAPLSN